MVQHIRNEICSNQAFFSVGGNSFFGKKSLRSVFLPVFFSILIFPFQIAGQIQQQFFEKCWEKTLFNNKSLFASDNENQIYLLTSENIIESLNSIDGNVNWTNEVGGNIISNILQIDDVLYVAGLIKNKTADKVGKTEQKQLQRFYLRAVNARSGIPLWSVNINLQQQANDLGNDNSVFQEKIWIGQSVGDIFFVDAKGNFALVQKDEGFIKQTLKIHFEPQDLFDFNLINENKNFKTNNQIGFSAKDGKFYLLDSTSGAILRQISGIKNVTVSALAIDKTLFLGDKKGNIFSTNLEKNGKTPFPLFRAGGEISGIKITRNGILATSLDNFVYLFSQNKGRIIWKRRLAGRLSSAPLVNESENVIVLVESDSAYLIQLSTGILLHQFSLPNGEYFTQSPILIKDRYVFQTNAKIVAYTKDFCRKN